MSISFTKMHGLGNDFVIIDGRQTPVTLSPAQVQAIANRNRGVGCDQLVLLHNPSAEGDLAVTFYNADGSISGACGNASRCIAWLYMQKTGKTSVTLETGGGLLFCQEAADHLVQVDMGVPRLAALEIPLSKEVDTLHLPLESGALRDGVGVSMGNPHAVFFVNDTTAINLAKDGAALEHHALFPERANIGAAQVIDRATLRLRVWERGSGETEACGTGACAAMVAAHRRGLVDNVVWVHLTGGMLEIRWEGAGTPVKMTGPVALSFTGTLSEELLHV